MKWYRDNRVVAGIMIVIMALVIYFGCKMMRAVGSSMGKEKEQGALIKDF